MKLHRLPRFPASESHFDAVRILKTAILLCAAPIALSAQTVTFSGAPAAVNFGNVNLCAAGKSIPAPCSETRTLIYNVTGSGNLGAPRVVTQGSPGLDFTLATGSTCQGTVTEGTTCKVNATFTPLYAGERPGAVEITDESGNILATTLIYGVGKGPQIAFQRGGAIAFLPFSVVSQPWGITVDTAGNVFVVNSYNLFYNNTQSGQVVELPAHGGPQITLPITFDTSNPPTGIAVDGAGDVLVANFKAGITDLPANGGDQLTLPFTGFSGSNTVAVNGPGDVFVANGADILELPGNGNPQIAFDLPAHASASGAAVDPAGNIFTDSLYEIPAGAGTPISFPIGAGFQGSGTVAVDAADDLFVTGAYGDLPVVEELPVIGSPITTPSLSNIFGYLNGPYLGLAVGPAGDVFVTDYYDNEIVEFLRAQPPATLDFGTLAIGGTSTVPLTISNIGNQTLAVTPLFSRSSFKVLSQSPASCLAAVLSGETCTAQLEFAPTTVGVQNGTLTLRTNGSANPPIITLLGTSTAVGRTPVINFSPDFSNATASSVQTNGHTALDGLCRMLTDCGQYETGSAFFTTPVNIHSFITHFLFFLSGAGQYDAPVADGFTFTIQRDGKTALGRHGEGLGYEGIGKSVAIKFDLYNNAGEGPDSTGLYVDGALPTTPAVDLTGTGIDLHSYDTFDAQIAYDGTNLELTLTDTLTQAVWSHAFPVDIPSTVGGDTAYVGFTAGTGENIASQLLFNWTFTNP